jgi:FkbM family methyltransferase
MQRHCFPDDLRQEISMAAKTSQTENGTNIDMIQSDVMGMPFVTGIPFAFSSSQHPIQSHQHRQSQRFGLEIDFIRKVIEPGYRVVDIGAGQGDCIWVAAAEAGNTGQIWAFEPVKAGAANINRTLTVEQYHWVHLVHSGISNERGYSKIRTGKKTDADGENPMDNYLFETIHLMRLDEAMRDFSWSEIGLVNINPENQAKDIFKGGVAFFSEHSPLVMIKIRQGQSFSPELFNAFKQIGYKSYRLISGLGCLIPIDGDIEDNPFYTYVFCCKPDRAAELASKGLLVFRKLEMDSGSKTAPNLWINYIQTLPYAIRLLRLWEKYVRKHERNLYWRLYQEALSSFAISKMTQIPLPDRLQALNWSYLLLKDVIQKKPTFSRLMSLVRVASDLGYLDHADEILSRLIKMMETGDNVSIDEPFLALSSHFEKIDPDQEIGNWCLVSLLETYEQYQPFSAHFTADLSLANLDLLKTLPFYNPEMEQRRKFIQDRFDIIE